MKNCFPFCAISFALLCVLQTPAGAQNTGDDIVAKVGNRSITVKEFTDGYEFGPAFVKRKENSKSVYLKYLINEELLSIEGEQRKLDTMQAFRDAYKDIYNDILTESLFDKVIRPRVAVPDDAIERAVAAQNVEITLKWIFCRTDSQLFSAVELLKEGKQFDTVFDGMLDSGDFADDRKLTLTKFSLLKKNPALAEVIDTLRAGMITRPVQGKDGWYILRIEEIAQSGLVTQSEYLEARQTAKNYLIKSSYDAYADKYVDSLMKTENPSIDGDLFRIARAYVGKYELKENIFDEWELGRSAEKAADKLKSSGRDPKDQPLVALRTNKLFLSDFISWYSSRDPYLKFRDKDKQLFSRDVETNIWRMVRDNMLVSEAISMGLQNDPEVKAAAAVWKNKILYAIVRDELLNSVQVMSKGESPVLQTSKRTAGLSVEASSALIKKIGQLKNKYKVTVNTDVLSKVQVTEEDNAHAIDIFYAKRGGIFPRAPFPSIDQIWGSWE